MYNMISVRIWMIWLKSCYSRAVYVWQCSGCIIRQQCLSSSNHAI